MKLCEYGCGQEAKYPPDKGRTKWCCSKYICQCSEIRRKNSEALKGKNNPIFGKTRSEETKKKMSEAHFGKTHSKKTKKRMSEIRKEKFSGENHPMFGKTLSEGHKKKLILSISKIKKKHPFFSQIEEMRYNLDKPGEKEIQVHCKNHECENSKEKGGWFTPTRIQLAERIRQLEHKDGNDGSYFYCSQECKSNCVLYNLKRDPYKETERLYTQEEYNIFKEEVLKRQRKEDGYNFCEKCFSTKKLHVHHEKPLKTHPILSLDPDNGIVLCEECHYKYGHKTGTECSTGNLASKVC